MFIKEVCASLYPWDLADQGVETCIDNVTEHAGVNSVYCVAIMHKEKRPLTSMFYTLNKVRKFYLPEDSRIYYRMDENNFKNTPLKPLYSQRDFLKGVDWFDRLTAYGRKLDHKVGVEISHTFYDSNVALEQHPDIFQVDMDGNPLVHFFCFNNQKVREYMKAIFYDTVKNHDVDYIQTCMLLFCEGRAVPMPWFLKDTYLESRVSSLLGVLNGGCYCPHCRAQAIEWGYDWDNMLAELRHLYCMVNSNLGGG